MPVGNDIIDLNRHSVSHRHTDERFIQKILHPVEIILLQQCQQPSLFLWLLWTLKEAAYKYGKQQDSQLLFSPRKLFVAEDNLGIAFSLVPNENFVVHDLLNMIQHRIHTDFGILNGHTVISKNYIHSLVLNEEKGIYWGIKKIETDQHKHQREEVRNFALESIPLNGASLQFEDKIPFIHSSGKKYPASFSHDGFYVSFAVATGLDVTE
jgi:hypothetical protein